MTLIPYPDPLPFKLQVLRALTAAIKEVTPTNGYVCDLADYDPGDGVTMERVYRGREYFGDEDPLPMVGILEGTNPADEVAEPPYDGEIAEYDWPLLIQGWTRNDPEHPTDQAYLLLADVRQRLNMERRRKKPGDRTSRRILGFDEDKITRLSIGPGVVRPPDTLSPTAWWWLNVTVRIVDNAAEPYA